MYTVGALKNAELAKSVYPNFVCRFYVDSTVPECVVKALSDSGAEIIIKPDNVDCSGMRWRFEPLFDPSVSVAIVRDADARLTKREAEAVREWLASGKTYHVMRDHPNHVQHIMAGMWGALCNRIPEFEQRLKDWKQDAFWGDFNFLDTFWESHFKNDHFAHDTFNRANGKPIPGPDPERGWFVGNKFQADDTPVYFW